MNWQKNALRTAGRIRYAAAQGLRSAWYTAQMQAVRRRSGDLTPPDEPAFRPANGRPSLSELRRAYLELFVEDRRNIEAGLYPAPKELNIGAMPAGFRHMMAFQADAARVNARRLARDGREILRSQTPGADYFRRNANRYPDYYLQNFHYQSGGWFTDESAELYDTQVEALFSGTADAMRRAALALVAAQMSGRDQRGVQLIDIGCGNGRFLEKILEIWPRLNAAGLDLSPAYTEAARRRLARWSQVEIIQDLAESMAVETASRDIAVSVYLFHELPGRVRGQVLAEIFRILKPGGVLVLADSLQFGDRPGLDGLLEYFPHGFHEPYYRDYLDWDLDGALGAAGFRREAKRLAFLTKVTAWRRPA